MFERAPIICVQDPPRLEVGDRLLDDIPDLVNLGIELFSQSRRSRWMGFLIGVSMPLPT